MTAGVARAVARRRRIGSPSPRLVRTILPHLAAPAACLALLVPFMVHQNAWNEWSNYYWLVQQQERAIRLLGHPSYFLHAGFGVFYPHYAFYGGSLWAAAGALAVLMGSAWASFLAFLAAAVAVAYGGTWWTGRLCGLSRLEAHAPALVVTAGPYVVVANLYGRGDWNELIALSALPLALGGALATIIRPRASPGPAVAVVAGVAVVAASHNLTMIWGTIFAVGLGAVLALVRRRVAVRRLALVAGLALVGAGLNGWYLLPALAYAGRTATFGQSHLALAQYSSLANLFSPVPRHPPGTDIVMYLQLPVWGLAWALAAGVRLRRAASRSRRGWAGFAALTAGLVIATAWQEPWRSLPHVLRTIQFTWRLDAYSTMAIAGLVGCGLLLTRASPRRWLWRGTLVIALAGQLGIAGYTAIATRNARPVRRADVRPGRVLEAFGRDQRFGFRFTRGGRVLDGRGLPALAVSPGLALDDLVVLRTPPTADARYVTNVVWSPLVRASGDASIAGRTRGGLAVIAVRNGGERAVLRPAAPFPVQAGRALTGLCGAFLLGLLGWWVLAARGGAGAPRRRRHG